MSDVDDVSSLDEYSDDDYDTDEEGNVIGLSLKTPATPHAQENMPASTLSKADILDGPLQRPFLTAFVLEFLRTRFGPAPGIRSLAGSEQTNSSSSLGSASGGAPSGSRGNGGGQKRSRENTQPLERNFGKGQDGNGNDPNKRRKGNPSANSTDYWKEKRYACPCYQRNPKLATTARCLGPGWPLVRRVKYDHMTSTLLPSNSK